MTPVFGHGRLRLYLLKLLDDGPKHGYELIRLLEERFRGLYTPSAGTVYPRLQRMETEGLVTHQAAGGRKVYEITERGRRELRERADELVALEVEIHTSLADLSRLAGEIRTGVRESIRDLRQELRAAARETRRAVRNIPSTPVPPSRGTGRDGVPRTGRPCGPPGPQAAGETDPGDEFERRLLGFVEEAQALARSRRFSDAQLRTAIRLLDGALDGLRRLLR
ncbi:PadR family transcriptional regulator [Plantactinospora sp. B5E13]|uniref:PadR family transcriptional regulator n=1 Tax=unclassified Plantactinospora TaxID=2631981 RepID=UPI00325F4C20